MSKRKFRLANEISTGSNVVLNIIFVLISIVCLFPILLVIAISFTEEKQILLHGYNIIPREFSIKAYDFVLSAGDAIMRSYGISILVTILGTILSMSVITLYAYPLARSSFRYKNFFSFFVFFTMIFGGGLVPWFMVYSQLVRIRDTIWIMIVPYLINGFYVMIMRTFIKGSVPEALMESAKIDGAGEFRTFFSIVLPLLKPGLATIGLLSCLGYWNDWYLPLVFVTKRELFNIQYTMYQTLSSIQFLTSGSANFAELGKVLSDLPGESARMAIAVISIGPIIFAYGFFQKYFIKGLTIGAVKG
jgi:putative aldouronate transport system permease protein